MSKLVFLDTETTGLDPERHAIWNLAMIEAEWVPQVGIVNEQENEWFLMPDLKKADPTALRLTRYYERKKKWSDPMIVAPILAEHLSGVHLIGAVPSFDAAFLERFLRGYGEAPAWHYHLIDVENLAAGKLGYQPPWDSEDLSRAVGVEPPKGDDRHTALADARWAKALYQAVMLSTNGGSANG